MIHCRSDFSVRYKEVQLFDVTEMPASEAVAGLTLSSVNYKEAVSTLKKWYGKRQLIIGKHMMNLEAVGSLHDIKKLRHWYDSVEAQV